MVWDDADERFARPVDANGFTVPGEFGVFGEMAADLPYGDDLHVRQFAVHTISRQDWMCRLIFG